MEYYTYHYISFILFNFSANCQISLGIFSEDHKYKKFFESCQILRPISFRKKVKKSERKMKQKCKKWVEIEKLSGSLEIMKLNI